MKFRWGSRCVECGKSMSSGQMQICEYGGHCSHHVPMAIMEELEKILRDDDQLTIQDQYGTVDIK